MKVSIRDVAKHANVSTATVSHVLNNSQYVTDATKQRVLDSVKELNYVPNFTAKSFKSGKRKLIGCIIPDISNYFWALVVDEIESVLASKGYSLLIANTKEDPEKEITDIKLFSAGLVDGIIIGSTLESADVLDKYNYTDIPLLFIDREPKNCQHDSILISNYTAMYKGVSNLIDLGHRKIGYIAGLNRLSTTIERKNAFFDAMRDHGIDVTYDTLIKYGDSMYSSAVQPACELIDNGCTALVISNNTMATDVISYLYNRKQDFPTHIDLLGYQEGLRDIYVIKPSGVITQPAADMGHFAAEQIVDRISNPSSPIKNLKLSSNLTLYSV